MEGFTSKWIMMVVQTWCGGQFAFLGEHGAVNPTEGVVIVESG